MDIEWAKEILAVVAQHGPWAMLCFYLVHKLLSTSKSEAERDAAYHTAVIENARVTERLAVLIEERTRGRSNGSQ